MSFFKYLTPTKTYKKRECVNTPDLTVWENSWFTAWDVWRRASELKALYVVVSTRQSVSELIDPNERH